MRNERPSISMSFAVLAALALAACDHDESRVASTLTLTKGAETTTWTDGPINAAGNYDPSFSADCDPTQRTLITMCSGVSDGGCSVLVNVNAAATTPGSYSISGGSSTATYFIYTDPDGQHWDSLAGQGTITLASVGAPGDPITGSFEAVLGLWPDPLTTIAVSGTFSVVRDH